MKRILFLIILASPIFGAESDPAIREYYDEKARIRMLNFEMPDDIKINLWADESQIRILRQLPSTLRVGFMWPRSIVGDSA